MKRRIVLVVAAVLLAATGTVAIYSYTRKADSRALAGQQAVRVLVASKSISAGTPANRALTTVARFPRSTVPSDAITDPKQITGQVAAANIANHQMLTAGLFEKKKAKSAKEASTIAGGLKVPNGMVAMPGSFTPTGQKYIKPGSVIAVFEAYTPMRAGSQAPAGDGIEHKQNANHVSRLLVPRATVLAVDTDPKANDGTKVTYVLAVTQRQAEQLILGLATGDPLVGVLRSDSSTLTPSQGLDNAHIFEQSGQG